MAKRIERIEELAANISSHRKISDGLSRLLNSVFTLGKRIKEKRELRQNIYKAYQKDSEEDLLRMMQNQQISYEYLTENLKEFVIDSVHEAVISERTWEKQLWEGHYEVYTIKYGSEYMTGKENAVKERIDLVLQVFQKAFDERRMRLVFSEVSREYNELLDDILYWQKNRREHDSYVRDRDDCACIIK